MENSASEVIIQDISPSTDTLQFILVKEGEDTEKDHILENQDEHYSAYEGQEGVEDNQNVSLNTSQPRNEIFRCDVCDKNFKSMSDLRTHANTLHLNAPPTKPLPKTMALPKKKSRRLKKKKDSWLSRLAEIRQTLPSYDSEKGQDEGRIWECESCRNSFNRKDHLAKHIAFVHERIRPYECELCGHRFSQKHHVAQHIQSKHENDESRQRPLACEHCGKRFARKEHVENHVKLVHEKRKPFECGVCTKKFSQKHHFLSHVSNMHGVKNDPGLIPTERELKLTVQTIEKSDQNEDVKKLSSSIRTKIRSKSLKPKPLNNKSDDMNSVDLCLENLEESLIPEADSGVSVEDQESTEEPELQQSSISIMKYNPHVCPFCDESFKQLPHLGAHIMAAHEPPTDDNPPASVKNKNRLSRYSSTSNSGASNRDKRVGERRRKKRISS